MPSGDTTRTILVTLGAGVGVALAKVVAAVVTASPAMAAEAAHSLADTANDLFLVVAQRRSARPPDKRHPFGYGREAYFWALIAALGVFIAAAAFSLRQGITDLIHPSAHLIVPGGVRGAGRFRCFRWRLGSPVGAPDERHGASREQEPPG